jgi:hypothetical protein
VKYPKTQLLASRLVIFTKPVVSASGALLEIVLLDGLLFTELF